MQNEPLTSGTLLDRLFQPLERTLSERLPELKPVEIGTVASVSRGIARVEGLPNVQSEELLRFPGGLLGLAFNLDADEIGVVLLDECESLQAGDEVRRTKRVLDVLVGEGLLGRVIDPVGRPLDGHGPSPPVSRGAHPPGSQEEGSGARVDRLPCEREATAIMDRLPVTVPLQTGLKVIDALIPVGRGQRELILGDRQTGKTAIAVDTILNQRDQGVICIYCAIGRRSTAVAQVIDDLRRHEALSYCVVVVAEGDAPPGLQFIAPFAATSIGEFFMQQGRDVLVVYDDLIAHARAYRELSLLLRRPPGREAYPGDIFYLHSRLLERSTHVSEELGGGSLTALPIAETEAGNVAAYIPTNLISITDGQIYLSPELFRKGILPAVDVGRSVSRVGGKTQLPAYRAVAGDLRLSYSQFEELEAFARFSSRMDEDTRQTLERGRRVREILKQPQSQPLPVPEQIAVLLAVTAGLFDELPVARIREAAEAVRTAVTERLPDVCDRILAGEPLADEDRQALVSAAEDALASLKDSAPFPRFTVGTPSVGEPPT